MNYTGVKVLEVDSSVIDTLYSEGFVEIPDKRYEYYPNMFVYLKSKDKEGHGAITVVSKEQNEAQRRLVKVKNKGREAFGVRPRNKEQIMALQALLDPSIPVNIMTGRAGTGKSLLSIAAALDLMQNNKYDRLIFTRPMSQVGKYNLGALPGTVEEKFGPYLQNYLTNIEQLVGNNKQTAQDLLDMYRVEMMPLQLIRGASWVNSIVIADEIQILDHHEMLTLGSRIGENSKLILLGDLKQRDEKIAKHNTGLFKMMNDKLVKESSLTSAIELIKCERSPVSKLFADVFEED